MIFIYSFYQNQKKRLWKCGEEREEDYYVWSSTGTYTVTDSEAVKKDADWEVPNEETESEATDIGECGEDSDDDTTERDVR